MKLDEILSMVTVAAKFGAIGLGAGRLLAVSGVLSGRCLGTRVARVHGRLFYPFSAWPSLLHHYSIAPLHILFSRLLRRRVLSHVDVK
jgi:hypothetical protein